MVEPGADPLSPPTTPSSTAAAADRSDLGQNSGLHARFVSFAYIFIKYLVWSKTWHVRNLWTGVRGNKGFGQSWLQLSVWCFVPAFIVSTLKSKKYREVNWAGPTLDKSWSGQPFMDTNWFQASSQWYMKRWKWIGHRICNDCCPI